MRETSPPHFWSPIFVPLTFTVWVWFIHWNTTKQCTLTDLLPQQSRWEKLWIDQHVVHTSPSVITACWSIANSMLCHKFCLSGNIKAVLPFWWRLLGLYAACMRHLSGLKKIHLESSAFSGKKNNVAVFLFIYSAVKDDIKLIYLWNWTYVAMNTGVSYQLCQLRTSESLSEST